MGEKPVVIDRNGTDAYRYVCPRGHTNWEFRGQKIACNSCPHGRVPWSESYQTLIDQKTGTEVDVDEVRVV